MRPAPSLLRTLALVVVAGCLCCCATTSRRDVTPQSPSLSSVVAGRFVTRVQIDGGNVVVEPASKTRPRLSATEAQARFRAADVVDGDYRFAVLGLGVATVSSLVPPVTTTTTGSGPTTTTTTSGAVPASTAIPTTPTTRPAPSTTTSTSTTAPGGTATSVGTVPGAPESTGATTTITTPSTATALPRYDNRLAWVGIAWGTDCPGRVGQEPTTTRYVVVIFDADTGRSALAYTSRSAAGCSGPVLPASVTPPNELVSIPWQPQGTTSTAVRVTIPACSTFFGWTEVPGQGAGSIQVVVRQPFDPECGTTATSTQTVPDVVPLGTSQAQLSHAALGPIDGLRTLAVG